jgi:hypothetical protein
VGVTLSMCAVVLVSGGCVVGWAGSVRDDRRALCGHNGRERPGFRGSIRGGGAPRDHSSAQAPSIGDGAGREGDGAGPQGTASPLGAGRASLVLSPLTGLPGLLDRHGQHDLFVEQGERPLPRVEILRQTPEVECQVGEEPIGPEPLRQLLRTGVFGCPQEPPSLHAIYDLGEPVQKANVRVQIRMAHNRPPCTPAGVATARPGGAAILSSPCTHSTGGGSGRRSRRRGPW